MITIHEAKATDTTTLGLGTLLPSKCLVREKAGGMYEMTLEHPMTEDMRHERIKPMRLIKAPAPVRETPLVEISQTGSVTREIYRVNTADVRLNMRAGASTDSKVIHAYRPGTEVVKLGEDGDWMQVAILDGGATGWMWADYLEYVRTETEIISGDTPGGIVQPRQTREQLFRVYRYNPDTKTRTVYADARHITYDLAGAIVEGEYDPEGVAADVVCAQLMARADHDVSDFHIYCTVKDKISGSYGGRNIIDCLLDPETGVVAQTKARIVRDNYDIFILPDEARNRGVELRYGKNLVSASMDTDVSDIITRIRPVGKDADGNKLYIAGNNGYVDSPYINDYPVVLSKEVEYDVVVSDDLPIDDARALLKEKAEADFVAGCDMATVKLDADFVRLELTEDYRQLANAYALHMYDSVPVIDREADIVATARMVEYAYEATLDEYESTGLGELEEVKSTIYGYELVDKSIQGGKLIPNTLNGNRLQNFSVSYGKFDIAAIKQLSADAITAFRADIRELVAGNITTDQLYADLAYIAAAQITAANIDKANIQWAEIESLTAEIAEIVSAKIGTADIDYAKIKDLTTNTAIITEGVGGKLYINRLAVTEANMVQLTVGELMLKDANGNFVRLTVDANGNVATEVVEVEGDNIADSTISGSNLIENTITARELNVAQIFADKALIKAIKAANIDVADLFAAEATINELNSYIIKASTIEALKGQLSLWADEKISLGVAAGVNTGTSGGVQVTITDKKIEMNVPGEDGDFELNESGGRLPVLVSNNITAPNVTPRYDGPATLYVNPNATSAQIAAGNYHRSLADALARLDKKWAGKNVTINLAAGMVEYGTLSLAGVSGGCWITIQGDSTNHAKLVGQLNLYYNTSPIAVKYLDVDMAASSGYGIYVVGSTPAEVNNCIVTGTGASGSHAIEARYGAAVYVTGCETYDCDRSLYGSLGGTVHAANCKGNCRVGANKTTIYLEGTQPCDSTTWAVSEYAGKVYTASVTVNQGSKPTAEAEPTTVNYNFTYADSYAGGWSYFEDADVRQGYTGGRRIYGVIWFNAATIKTALTGKTIKQASLRLYMQSGVGRGVSVSVQMYGTSMAYDGRSGAPALTTTYGTIGSTTPGEVNTITIPTQVIADIVSGKIQALVLYSDDTDYYSGRSYSKNYARFDGSTSGSSSTRPMLTVMYS